MSLIFILSFEKNLVISEIFNFTFSLKFGFTVASTVAPYFPPVIFFTVKLYLSFMVTSTFKKNSSYFISGPGATSFVLSGAKGFVDLITIYFFISKGVNLIVTS